MIIVKDKGAKSQIYIQRNNVTNLQNNSGNSGGSVINKAELDKYLKDYATKEYVDKLIGDIESITDIIIGEVNNN